MQGVSIMCFCSAVCCYALKYALARSRKFHSKIMYNPNNIVEYLQYKQYSFYSQYKTIDSINMFHPPELDQFFDKLTLT